MAIPSVLVCDDSTLARRLALRALPDTWRAQAREASSGEEAIALLAEQTCDLLLLDLTMHGLDGFGVLQHLKKIGFPGKIVVVSADVQDETVRQVFTLGASAFVRKPIDADNLLQTVAGLGVWDSYSHGLMLAPEQGASFLEVLAEVVNIAMGRAAALLARVLGVFIALPVPNVNMLMAGELQMALQDVARQDGQRKMAVCQGFIGGGIAGEALLIFHETDVKSMASLIKSENCAPSEVLLDVSALVISACLSSLADQMSLRFSQGHPQILGRHTSIEELIAARQGHWPDTLAVEISYSLKERDIHFDLLLLFTEDSMPLLESRLAYLLEKP